MEEYVFIHQKRLRRGYTTGSCAAAAARAACLSLLKGEKTYAVELHLPGGEVIRIPVFACASFEMPSAGSPDSLQEDEKSRASFSEYYAVKDGGDDPDVTTGAQIHVRVSFLTEQKKRGAADEHSGKTGPYCPDMDRAFWSESYPGLYLTGGEGVGIVTKPGLEQEIGQYAINRVPREMIFRAVSETAEEAGYEGELLVRVYVPGGAEIAAHTFNPMLGITGGISILGTTGIVDPMSEKAILDTIRLQIRQKAASGAETLLVTPGRYGLRYAKEYLGLSVENAVECSKFIGETIDYAAASGMKGLLLVGNFGKLVKLAAGIMNTHSGTADGRAEILTAHAALCGGGDFSPERASALMESTTTDGMLALLKEWGICDAVVGSILFAIERHVRRRAGGAVTVGVVIFSEKYGYLGQTSDAGRLLSGL